MRMNTTQRIVMAALMSTSAVACSDITGPAADRPVEVIETPALNPAVAARIAVLLDDALTRLLPADATSSALGAGLSDLAGALDAGDAPALVLRTRAVWRALDTNPLDPADRHALEMMLTWVEEALTRAAAAN